MYVDRKTGVEMRSVRQRQYERSLSNDEYFCYIIDKILDTSRIDEFDENFLNELIDCFRYLRNRLASPEASVPWNLLLERAEQLCIFVDGMVSANGFLAPELTLVLYRVAIQFLGNAVTCKETAETFRNALWRDTSGITFFIFLADHPDTKLRVYGTMVLYNCLFETKIWNYVRRCSDLTSALLQYSLTGNEWASFIVQRLLAEEESFMTHHVPESREALRLIALHIAQEMLAQSDSSTTNSGSGLVNEGNVVCMARYFICDMKKLVTDWPKDNSGLELVAAELEFLCQATSLEHYYQSIRDNEEILAVTLNVLRLSRQYRNDETIGLNALAGFSRLDDSCTERPSYRFRGNLIRLLANLCYKHPVNQRLIREREGIPLILDCTPLDAENPFITEWCVFALKNLMDGCPENQNVIESLTSGEAKSGQ